MTSRYTGQHVRTVGHRRYDDCLKQIVTRVQHNASREELLSFVLDELGQISLAQAIFVLEADRNEMGQAEGHEAWWFQPLKALRGWGQRKIEPPQRWQNYQHNLLARYGRFTITRAVLQALREWAVGRGGSALRHHEGKEFSSPQELLSFLQTQLESPLTEEQQKKLVRFSHVLASDSLLLSVLEDSEEIDGWDLDYFSHLRDEFKPLIDGEHLWVVGIHLPRPTAQHPVRGLFLLYASSQSESPPPGIEQDWRLLSFLRLCYAMASFQMAYQGRQIFLQRQELIRTLAPSILMHEVNGPVSNAYDTVTLLVQKFETQKIDAARVLHELKTAVLPTLQHITDLSHALLRLQTEIREPEAVALSKILEQCHDIVYYRMGRAGAAWEVTQTPQANFPSIRSDGALLLHAVLNVVNNALDALEALPQAPRNLDFHLHWDETEKLPLKLKITNNGAPIPRHELESIFEIGVTHKLSGHGLGLTIVRAIIEHLGGTVEALPWDEGACFQICLPAELRKDSQLFREAQAHYRKHSAR